jgi:hypothetical protein
VHVYVDIDKRVCRRDLQAKSIARRSSKLGQSVSQYVIGSGSPHVLVGPKNEKMLHGAPCIGHGRISSNGSTHRCFCWMLSAILSERFGHFFTLRMSVKASRLAEPLSPHCVAVDVIVRGKWGIRHVRLAKPPVAGLESSATRWWLPARKEKRKIRYTKGSVPKNVEVVVACEKREAKD